MLMIWHMDTEVFIKHEKLRDRFYCKGMHKDAEHWVCSCVDCANRKHPHNTHCAPLLPVPVDSAFQRLALDILGPLPVTWQGNRYHVVFTEYLSKWPEIFATKNINAITIAKLLTDKIIPHHRAPRTLLSHWGKTSFQQWLKRFAISIQSKSWTPRPIIHKPLAKWRDSIPSYVRLFLCLRAAIRRTGTFSSLHFSSLFVLLLRNRQPKVCSIYSTEEKLSCKWMSVCFWPLIRQARLRSNGNTSFSKLNWLSASPTENKGLLWHKREGTWFHPGWPVGSTPLMCGRPGLECATP